MPKPEKEPALPPLGRQIKGAILEWFLSSTSHGICKLFRQNFLIIRVIWLICFLASSTYCCYSIYSSVVNYYGYSIVDQITSRHQHPVTFPAITFCNQNTFTTKEGLDFVDRITREKKINKSNFSQFDETVRPYPSNDIIADDFLLKMIIQNYAMSQNESYRKSFGHSLDDFMISCIFSSMPCNRTEIEWFYHLEHGNCFQFNTVIYDSSYLIWFEKKSYFAWFNFSRDLIQMAKKFQLNKPFRLEENMVLSSFFL